MFRRIRGLSREAWSQQSGITGLETAIVLIAFIVVAAVFAFAVLTTGLFSTETAKQTALTGLGQATSTLASRGAVTAEGVQLPNPIVLNLKFRLTNAAGNESVGLAPSNTLVTFYDENNQVTLAHLDDVETPDSGDTFWYHTWVLGSGDSVEPGEVVEFTVDVGAMSTADGGSSTLGPNTTFKVEIIPAEGAVVVLGRTTPLEITSVMDMD